MAFDPTALCSIKLSENPSALVSVQPTNPAGASLYRNFRALRADSTLVSSARAPYGASSGLVPDLIVRGPQGRRVVVGTMGVNLPVYLPRKARLRLAMWGFSCVPQQEAAQPRRGL